MGGGIGIGLRPELVHGLLAAPKTVDFLEVVAETANARNEWRREAIALSEVWPIVPHGVKLSLASANGIDEAHAKKLGDLARDVRAELVTEHVALTRTSKREIGHLTAVPFTRETVAIVARNTAIARRSFPDVPFLLENPAWTLRWPDEQMHEGDFYEEIAEATGCGLLLDVANVYANAKNLGVDPLEFLERHPLERVRMLHVAGGIFEDGFFFDTHAHAVNEEVFALTARVLEVCGDVPIVLERDGHFPDFSETATELATLRSLRAAAVADTKRFHREAGKRGKRSLVCRCGQQHLAAPAHDSLDAGIDERDAEARRRQHPRSAPLPRFPVESSRCGGAAAALDDVAVEEMAARQEALAAALVGDGEAPFDARAIDRTRAVLREKRLDDALPLLPRLMRRRGQVEAIVRPMVPSWPRPDALVGPADALRIAEAAEGHSELASDARLDRQLLRARFVGPSAHGEVKLRAMPFVGREGSVWAVKGPGTQAPVRVFSRGGIR
jgi:uncharacterized protein (UPF0276 family)